MCAEKVDEALDAVAREYPNNLRRLAADRGGEAGLLTVGEVCSNLHEMGWSTFVATTRCERWRPAATSRLVLVLVLHCSCILLFIFIFIFIFMRS